MAIRSFADARAEQFFVRGTLPWRTGWAGVAAIARRKLDMLHYAADLRDLASPPSNRLEGLRGNLQGHHSIRINDRWRIVFRWTKQGAEDVRIADYH
jgi:toxin HigB-1